MNCDIIVLGEKKKNRWFSWFYNIFIAGTGGRLPPQDLGKNGKERGQTNTQTDIANNRLNQPRADSVKMSLGSVLVIHLYW